jgi:CP family cyanate transporter-like MFS transporter
LLTAVLATVRRPWARARLWYVTGGIVMTAGCLGFAAGLTALAWLWASLAGLGGGMIFAGAVALPTLLARTRELVAGYAALTQTVGYAFSFFGPLLGGVLLDQTHLISSPFWVMTLSAAAAAVLGATLPVAGIGLKSERLRSDRSLSSMS